MNIKNLNGAGWIGKSPTQRKAILNFFRKRRLRDLPSAEKLALLHVLENSK